MSGVAVGAIGIGICGIAGRLKEKQLKSEGAPTEFSITKGLLLSLLAGVLSAVYNFSIECRRSDRQSGRRITAPAFGAATSSISSPTPALSSPRRSTACICTPNTARSASLIQLPAGPEENKLPLNFGMAALTGLLWYGQFFFYNLGHVRMGSYKFTSWAIHMTMLVLFSNLIAIVLREWKGCRRITQLTIGIGLGDFGRRDPADLRQLSRKSRCREIDFSRGK